MRIAALVLGVVGAVFGLIAAVLALGIGGVGSAFNAQRAGTVVNLGLGAIGFAVLGLIGGSVAIAKPRAAAALLSIAADQRTAARRWLFDLFPALLIWTGLFTIVAR